MRRACIILVMVLLGGCFLFAQNNACKTVIGDGVSLYNAGKYQEAKQKFESAKRIQCDEAQAWIDRCNAKLNPPKAANPTPKPVATPPEPAKTPKQTQCELFWEGGKKAFDAEEYETALMFFRRGVEEECDNVDFKSYIDVCNLKLEKKREQEAKNVMCNQFLVDGESAFAEGKYDVAKVYFNQGLASGCSDDIFQKWITACNDKIAYQNATLEVAVTEVEFDAQGGSRTINISSNTTWTNSAVSNWLYASKSTAYLLLSCNPNESTKERVDFFMIQAGNKSVRIDVRQKGQMRALDLTETYRLMYMNMNSNPTNFWSSGDRYKGQKDTSGFNGLGAYYWSNRTIYFGEFTQHQRTGTATYIAPDGYYVPKCEDCIFYVGGWENSRKVGTARCYNNEGQLIYQGGFANDEPTDAYPTTTDLENYRFELIPAEDGSYYVGETLDGKKHGYGTCFWKEGGMWYGSWENGVRKGYGVNIPMTGEIKAGNWDGDIYSEGK